MVDQLARISVGCWIFCHFSIIRINPLSIFRIMHNSIRLLEDKRAQLLELTKKLSLSQYNKIPDGFNNNVIWNMGHTLAVAENYFYIRNGLSRPFHAISLAEYERGTKPDQPLDEYQVEQIRTLLSEPVPFSVENEYHPNKLNWPASNVISEMSINFVLFHDDYHYNAILSILSAMGVREP